MICHQLQLCPNTMPRDIVRLQLRRTEQGFTLVEVLISIVILSFGMLGMVGLQAGALQANREAKLQSVGTGLARELAEKMRGNHEISKLTTNNPYLGTFNTDPLVAATPTFCLSVGVTACTTSTTIAAAEMTEWLARVSAEMPGAQVSVCFDTTPFDANGLPQWTCTNTGDIAIIKIGWTRGSTNKSQTGAAAFERATVPSVVFPVTPANVLTL